jgi:DNA-binding CsgD family transcriptional regulator
MHDVASMRRDPVMQHCRHHSLPIIWNQDTYTRAGLGELWEEQARFGYRTGIAMALHLPDGKHFAFGVERDQPLPADRRELMRMVADLQLFAVHAQDAALRLLGPALQAAHLQQHGPVPERVPTLTPRELEALRWTREGKTAWEVGGILGISERTAVLHVNNAMHKLGCASKHQAVLKALRLGLIH